MEHNKVKSWQVSWKTASGDVTFVLHGYTRSHALEKAREFGYCEPKFWQFWRNKIQMHSWY